MRSNSKLIRLLALLVIVIGAMALPGEPARAQTSQVVVLEATGPVVPPFGAYIQRGLAEADRRNAEAVILMLDTPGGSVGVTLDIIQNIRNSDVPVIVYVGPAGAEAASAGLLITLAGHAAVMAPDTAIGASSPIGPGGEDLPETLADKAENYLSAQARSLAERRGPEAVALADDAVRDARAVTASEALDAGLIDLVASDTEDLLAELDGVTVEVAGQERTLHTAGASLVRVPMTPVENVLMGISEIVADPNVVFVLLGLGVTLIIIEARSPGGWVAGTLGVICLSFALYGLGILPVNWLGMVFIVMAFALFFLEVKAPTHGALTAAGVASMAVGAIILFSQPEIAPFGELSIPLVIGQSLVLGGLFFVLVTIALRAQKRRPTTGYEGLIGQKGRVTQDINPRGVVVVWGERWHAESAEGAVIPAGSQIEVVEATGMTLRVRPRG